MLSHATTVFTGAFPIAVGDFGDDFASLFDGLEDRSNVQVPVQGALNANLDIIEVDEYSDLKTVSIHR
jgi:hypothetical protein